MLRCQKTIISIICLSVFAITLPSQAADEIEDLIDIAKSKDRIIAIIKGKKTVSFDLRPDEKVLWSGSRGDLGSFLTDQRFFVISTSLDAWQALPLKVDESGDGVTSLSPYIVLLVTKNRAIAFDATSNRFTETLLPLHDELVAAEAERFVALVITSSRAFGLAIESSAFNEILLRTGETIDSVKMTYRKATVRTSERLLSFEVSASKWREQMLY